MSKFSPLMCILDKNRLTGPNYVDWKKNLDIVLTSEEYKYVLDTPCPEAPTDESTEPEIQEYNDWNKANDMAKCNILASMSNVLQHQHQAMATAYDMIWNLKAMFGDQNRAARQVAMRCIMNTQMAEGTPVRDHVLKMMGHLNELEILGAEIDVLSLIFIKLDTIDILASAQWVCSSWWKLSKQPHLFRCIHVKQVLTLFGRSVDDFTAKLSKGLAREAIDRSSGQLVEFSVRAIASLATDEILLYMSEKSSSLRCIRLVSCHGVSDNGLIQIAKKLPLLEELEIINSTLSKEVVETFGRFCPLLKSCRLNSCRLNSCKLNSCRVSGTMFRGVAVAIAQNMPNLRYLHLFGNRISNVNLRAILNGCPLLEFLDLRQCFDLNISGSEYFERCGNIKVRFPNDPTDDFEYERYDYSWYDSLYDDMLSRSDLDTYESYDYDDGGYFY